MKKTRQRNESHAIGIAVVDLFISEQFSTFYLNCIISFTEGSLSKEVLLLQKFAKS